MCCLELKKVYAIAKQADEIFLKIDETVTQHIKNFIRENSSKPYRPNQSEFSSRREYTKDTDNFKIVKESNISSLLKETTSNSAVNNLIIDIKTNVQ